MNAMSHKLYISGLAASLVAACLVVIASTVFAIHDASEYRSLPEEYRSGVEKLQADWHYAGLPKDEQAGILDLHQQWRDQEKLPWWGADPPVDPHVQKAETLSYFEEFVPRWGSRIHQQRPVLAVAISFLAFVPTILLVGGVKWLRWLRSPDPVAG